MDAAGKVHLVYAESQAGPFARYGIRYTCSTDDARSFAPPLDISRPMLVGFRSTAFTALALDAMGRVGVLWNCSRRRARGRAGWESPCLEMGAQLFPLWRGARQRGCGRRL